LQRNTINQGGSQSHTLAAIQVKVVEYKHGNAVLEGYLAYNDTIQGKRPGVLVVHEWNGLKFFM
jgi:hypothetical protein